MSNEKACTRFYSTTNDRNKEEKLLESYIYLDVLKIKEYEYISKLLRAFNVWLKLPQVKIEEIMVITDMAATLLTIADDIQDNSLRRIGLPAAHVKYGLPATTNAINYATFIISEKVSHLQHPDAINIYIKYYGLESFRGQGMEIHYRENFKCPSEEEYLQMIGYKARGYIIMSSKLMQLFSDSKTDLTKLAKMIGIFSLIFNDYINLKSEKYMKTKRYCEDITEGKFTFPIIHGIKARPDDNRVLDILKMRTEDNKIKKRCVALLEEFGSLRYTEETLLKLKEEILEESRQIGKNSLFMDTFEDYYSEFISNNN